MSLALAIDQVQRGTWWNEPSEPWRANASVRNLIKPALEAGQIRRVTIDGIVHLEAA